MVTRLGETDEEAQSGAFSSLDDLDFNYSVACTEYSSALDPVTGYPACANQESQSRYFVDADYGFDYADYYNERTENFLNNFVELTGDEIADTSNLGTLAYAASLQAQQGRKDKIGDEENPEKGTIWESIKKDQDEITRLETGEDSKKTAEQEIDEIGAIIKDQLCLYEATLSMYKKLFEDMEMKLRDPSGNKDENSESSGASLVDKDAEELETELDESNQELQEVLGSTNAADFEEELVNSTKYLYSYVYRQSSEKLQAYNASGYLGNYSGQLPREIVAEYICVIKTDDVIACKAKYEALSKENEQKKGCFYTGTVPGPAPPLDYGRECKKEDQGKKNGLFLTCTCNG